MNDFVPLSDIYNEPEQHDIYHLDGFEPKYYFNLYVEDKVIERSKILIPKQLIKKD